MNAILYVINICVTSKNVELLTYGFWVLSNYTNVKKYLNEFVLLRNDLINRVLSLY